MPGRATLILDLMVAVAILVILGLIVVALWWPTMTFASVVGVLVMTAIVLLVVAAKNKPS